MNSIETQEEAMTIKDVSRKDCTNVGLEDEKANREPVSKRDQLQLYEKVYRNIHYKTDSTLCDLGTVTVSPRWFWESYPM